MTTQGHGIGFLDGIEQHLPTPIVIDVIREMALSGAITPGTTDETIRTLLVRESLKQVSYEDYLVLADYLFVYPKGEEVTEVALIEPSKRVYQQLQEHIDAFLTVKGDTYGQH
ncbi:hypothetical protein [Streptococcus dentiloxodontae]